MGDGAFENDAGVSVFDQSMLSSQTLSLVERLDPRLSNMLQGAWFAILGPMHADSFSQAAHSVRELMEKAPQFLPEVPIEQGSKTLNEEVKALHDAWKVIRAGSWSTDQPWTGTCIDDSLDDWLAKARAFFEGYAASHQSRKEQMALAIQALDKSGQTLPENLMAIRVKQWDDLRSYFLAICHHGKDGELEEFRTKLSELEIFLLALIHPEPIPLLDELDELIAEGEGK